MTITQRSLPVLTLATLAASGTAFAIDAGGIAIHGSLSATGAYADYDYYGETADHFDLIARELTLNGAYRFENGLRAAAQIYAYDLAGYSDLTLRKLKADDPLRSNIEEIKKAGERSAEPFDVLHRPLDAALIGADDDDLRRRDPQRTEVFIEDG